MKIAVENIFAMRNFLCQPRKATIADVYLRKIFAEARDTTLKRAQTAVLPQPGSEGSETND